LLKDLAKRLARTAGLQVRRAPDAEIPFLRTIVCDGESFRFWIANQHARAWWDKPILPMNAEFRSLKEMCRPGAVVLDVGAHHGMDTVLLARWVGPSGHVYGLEANAENALVLDANIAANRLTNCTGFHTAVGATAGSLRLVNETVDDANPLARMVPLTTLDDFCGAQGLDRADLVKIDVEGYEGHVLRGAPLVLASRPALALELHLDCLARYGSSPQAVLGLIDLASYEASMMVRPDWETLHPFGGIADLRSAGTVNVFLRPR